MIENEFGEKKIETKLGLIILISYSGIRKRQIGSKFQESYQEIEFSCNLAIWVDTNKETREHPEILCEREKWAPKYISFA